MREKLMYVIRVVGWDDSKIVGKHEQVEEADKQVREMHAAEDRTYLGSIVGTSGELSYVQGVTAGRFRVSCRRQLTVDPADERAEQIRQAAEAEEWVRRREREMGFRL